MKKPTPLLLIFFAASSLIVGGCATVPARVSVPPQGLAQPGSIAPGGIYHTVHRGETIYRIAKNYGVTVNDLMRANKLFNPRDLDTGKSLFIPMGGMAPSEIAPPSGGMSWAQVQSLVGPRRTITVWRTITLHHSGTHQGSAKLFDRDHTRRRMGGLFYHFVIGNGTYTPDGSIEVGWRWREQVKANRPNDIQICLVGNFDEQNVSEAQIDTLSKLISVLRKQNNISIGAIRKHCDIKGKHTDCPGTKFPFKRLLQRVKELG